MLFTLNIFGLFFPSEDGHFKDVQKLRKGFRKFELSYIWKIICSVSHT